MTKLSISEVSKRWGVSRQTLYRYKKQGKLSFDKDGRKVVLDLSEVIRVLGHAVSQDVTSDKNDTVTDVTSADNELKLKIEMLEKQVAMLEDSLSHSRKSEDELRSVVASQTKLITQQSDEKQGRGLLSRLFKR
ncbi:hypothetical protein XMM379_003139 [Aliiroseovarius sp. xm-m-379]|uniref:helix-turn-helix domain-containing protein n=2 Tax=Pseudomonadota TaxID=1224 RepID=UPI0015686412|nr:hypothetical protein [Aliiroseovarius sp. xm-m-379]NRP51448.1 hypothetical protein [Aliiroseovarius sp. xm-m-354]NRP96268.1 Helix-turn-helix domain protein [Marinobacterium sp. xm-g-59]NRQ06198.1 hypothetical protein [Aliiroseovarius sp. xm-m-309]NRQ09402.1 hypothetical protein [Aliiroseovarius sp. xm-v-201]NRQ12778.1 hypothetical protein [Aliiroseovarius sp. xm-v-208]